MSALRAWFSSARTTGASSDDAPLPMALLTLDQLEEHARASATRWAVSSQRTTDRLLARLTDNRRRLARVGARLEDARREGINISPAGAWLLDNQPLIEEQVDIARRHLPQGYSRSLPHFVHGPSAGLPRVYHLALDVIAHVDGRVDADNLTRFVAAWQQGAPLELGELWAIPIMLRLALIENLRRVASRVEVAADHRTIARRWATALGDAEQDSPRALLLVAADMARSAPELSDAFVAEIVQHPPEKGALEQIPLTWIEHELAAVGSSVQARVQAASGDQAANQVSVSSSIGSLRFLATMPWRDFVEDASTVDAVLRTDPSGVYATMDFATRDRYRHAVEDLAREASTPEPDLAARAIALARAGTATADGDTRQTHVGHYLVGDGRMALIDTLPGMTATARARHRHRQLGWAWAYFGALFGVTLAVTAAFTAAVPPGHGSAWLLLPALFTAASPLGVGAANWLATTFHAPAVLPRLALGDGIPARWRTLVIVPTLLTDRAGIDGLLDNLEVRYLGNASPNVRFGLLTDLRDAPTATTPGDEALVAYAVAGVRALNARHAPDAPFYLFHRAREYNASERTWMGYERKRGKLEALNQLLRGLDRRPDAPTPAFDTVEGARDALLGTAFVITLDTDTGLPRNAARKLIGTLAHPLNRPRWDAATGRVHAGYGILQPRVAIHLPSVRRSWFVRLFAGDAGIDPYTRAVSDVYQDLFREGSFVGKGIYDVDAFTQAIEGRLPDNLILSHDLIEGCFARSGLVSDVVLYEDHPSHVLDAGVRQRRWTRGDWQILWWFLPWAPDRAGRWRRNPLTALSRWKISDNLRRSMVPLATTGVAAWGLIALPHAGVIALGVVGVAYAPVVVASALGLLRRPGYEGVRAHLRYELRAAAERASQAAVGLAFLPEHARNSVDAIVRAATRVLVTRRRLLEWQAARAPSRSFVRTMVAGPALALAVLVGRALLGHTLADPSLLLLLPWAASPWVAQALSADRREGPASLPAADQARLRRLARATWRYFDRFVGAEDHGLPPDNVQEIPDQRVAHRTSPTNIGVSLLSDLAAHDFGWLSTASLTARVRRTLDTLRGLETYRGHFFNWYDTTTLEALPPRYVSSVDSGNLLGHLLVLERGLDDLDTAPAIAPRAWQGLADAIDLVVDLGADLGAEVASLRRSLDPPPRTLADVARAGSALRTAWEALRRAPPSADPNTAAWVDELLRQGDDAVLSPLRDLLGFLDDLPDNDAPADGLWRRGAPVPALGALAAGARALGPVAVGEPGWCAAARASGRRAEVQLAEAHALARIAASLSDMDLDFLYDARRRLFSIGYSVDDHRRDVACYDLLASEARMLSFLAIARGAVPESHWFALGRQLTSWRYEPALLSWSGSMFEYLMPQLVMPTFRGTLLDETSRAVVRRQIAWGRRNAVPWGVSESGYNLTDSHHDYQYKAFGIPGLGLKRGLGDDVVIAPYATVMALMVDPAGAFANLQRLTSDGFEGRFGYYEAVDYTPRRQQVGARHAVVRSHMAHHQGMSLLALAAVLLDHPMRERFRSHPSLRATELLLHERVPRTRGSHAHRHESAAPVEVEAPPGLFVLTTAATRRPTVHLLSNGRYAVMITNAGGGYSRWNGLALTRWREDPTRDDWGSFLYLRDVDDGTRWSAAHQPTGAAADRYEAIFVPSRAEFRRRDGDIELHTEIAVSPEDDVELRRFTVTNLGTRTRTLELTSYAEVVLAPQAADTAHPAFNNLFVQTEVLPDRQAILCTRRPRTDADDTPVLLHVMTAYGPIVGAMRYETSRRTFLGRGRTAADPAGTLDGGEGSVLDPIVAIQCRLTLAPEESARVHVVTGVAPSRADALTLVDRYHDGHTGDRVFELAFTHRQVMLRQLGISEVDAELYLRMASAIVYADPAGRASAAILATNRRGQSSLWAYGISGDLPIVVLRVASADTAEAVRQVLRAHVWWREMGLRVDLIVWDESEGGYQDSLRDLVLAGMGTGVPPLDVPGGVFIRRVEQFAQDDRVLLQTVARLLLHSAGDLADQLHRRARAASDPPRLVAHPRAPTRDAPDRSDLPEPGFVDDGRAYRIVTRRDARTPAPWSNVLSNPHFGTLVTESGGAYTWCENAHEYRLTPWDNDPVSDRSGEAFYVRDEETGAFWSPTPLPAPTDAAYVTHHRFGRSTFDHEHDGVRSALTMCVALDAPVKLVLVTLTNTSARRRRLSLTGYCEWVLGEHRAGSLLTLTTEVDATHRAVLARNPYHPDFGARIGFFGTSASDHSLTGDRTEFIGRNGTLAHPAALDREGLSGRVGAGLDTCAALHVPIDLDPGASTEVVFVLGVGRELHDVRTLLHRFRTVAAAQHALADVVAHWEDVLGAVQVHTPDPDLDVLVNGWLPYQVIACRLWARTGFYQSGGAFGFRDQLQDAMGLMLAAPGMLRAQIVRCAGRQFPDGDVQHWWHPPSGRGVRTHCADDYLWLPAAVARYVAGVGDTGVLDVRVHYLDGRQVKPQEEAYLDLPHPSAASATVYEHCVQAIQRALRFGEHGLPLMAGGDWNDGMNLVGHKGRGESVWLGFFLFDVLTRFADVARGHGDAPFATRCTEEAAALATRIDDAAWDGGWYLRAWFDNGEPLGASARTECRITSIPQSWAVLSGAGPLPRARAAMDAVYEHLVDPALGIVKLLAPPFDTSEPNPGYIRGYVPGVRENGGQYTHAALWAAMAFARLGDTERAWEVTRRLFPQSHTRTATDRARYRVEPYVLAADVYAVGPHAGMGGWTWQTGAAAWMLRLLLESLLGLEVRADRLRLDPRVPATWPGFTVDYRHRRTPWTIRARRARDGEAPSLTVDGVVVSTPDVGLVDDGAPHTLDVVYVDAGPHEDPSSNHDVQPDA